MQKNTSFSAFDEVSNRIFISYVCFSLIPRFLTGFGDITVQKLSVRTYISVRIKLVRLFLLLSLLWLFSEWNVVQPRCVRENSRCRAYSGAPWAVNCLTVVDCLTAVDTQCFGVHSNQFFSQRQSRFSQLNFFRITPRLKKAFIVLCKKIYTILKNLNQKIFKKGKSPGLVVNVVDLRSKPWSLDVGSNRDFN